MDRREILRSLFWSATSAAAFKFRKSVDVADAVSTIVDTNDHFSSKWHLYPDMIWTGEDLWAQRLQDFSILNGKLHCLCHGPDRTVHLLTHQLSTESKGCNIQTVFKFVNEPDHQQDRKNFAGVRLGVKGRFNDYRSAIMTGKGVDAGITRSGYLFIGDRYSENKLDEPFLTKDLTLKINVVPGPEERSTVSLEVMDTLGKVLGTLQAAYSTGQDWSGNIALVSHFTASKKLADKPTVIFSSLEVKGEGLSYNPQHIYGPIYFAQYTTTESELRLSAQLAPVDQINSEVKLWVKKNKRWEIIGASKPHPLARTATFIVSDWDNTIASPYKVTTDVRMKNGDVRTFSYEGTIAAEPKDKKAIRVLGFSCNWDYGFPDTEVVLRASAHKADLAFFLGDQFYESNGGFGVQMNPIEKSSLDYLRKWIMFGWSYRELFRHIPMAALPDDHDVYHGNLWGSGGRPANPLFGGAVSQDSGGYKMPADWVNMAQLTQTSHMPRPFDPTPVSQGIQVFYCNWKYAGINFALIEDRKFKSPPKDILPPEADVYNGFSKNVTYDASKEKILEANLIGERQVRFLKNWMDGFTNPEEFRVLVSATPFCCLQTLPANEINDNHNTQLPIPVIGEYVLGDVPVKDMDSNGWPHNRRDEIVKMLGQRVHLHLCGDQHLPSVVQYGTDQFDDGTVAFAVPSLSNIWPRRWWPDPKNNLKPLPGKPAYAGSFLDGFDNKITVHAVANPHSSGRSPALLHDRVTGYAVLEFNKETNQIKLNCWPRYAATAKEKIRQFEGWPLTVNVDKLKIE